MAILKTNLEKSELLKIIEQIQNNENYSQAYFVEVIEALESELINLPCTCTIEVLSDLEVITIN